MERVIARFPGPINYYPRHEIASTTGVDDAFPGLSTCTVPTSGAQKALVLLVQVNDYAPPSGVTSTTVHDKLFGTTGATMRTYFQQSSAQASSPLTFTGDVFGWKTVNHTNSDESTTDLSEVAFQSDPIVQKALMAFDGDIDYSEYDSNSDGCVDYLFVVHSGPDQAMTRNNKDIWSHFEFYMPEERHSYDGKEVYGTTVISVRSPVGVFSHEMAHNLGLPDLYSFGPPNKSIIGYWSLMDLGIWSGERGHKGERPTDLDPWSAIALGWLTPTTISSETTANILAAPGTRNVLKVPLGLTGPDDDEHYLLIEARRNQAATSAPSLNDAYLPSSGVLVWEADHGGRNTYGSLRQLLRLHDAYPTERTRGFAPESLLNDAPYQPQGPGVSYRFEARGTTVHVNSTSVTNGYSVTVTPPTETRPELVAQWIRETADPHDLGSQFQVRVEVFNAGTAAATDVSVDVARIAPTSAWDEGSVQNLGTIEPGVSKFATYTVIANTAGHVDLHADVSSHETGTLTIRDRGYIDGRITDFQLAATTSVGEDNASEARAVYDWLHAGCVLDCGSTFTYPTPQERADCLANICPLYDFDMQYPSGSFDATFCNSGSYKSCRGEITKTWVGDFLRNGQKQILVAHRDYTHRDRCVASGDCPHDYEPPNWLALTMYALDDGGLEVVWRMNPANHPAQPWNCYYYGQDGLATAAAVLDRGTGPEIFVTGYCGGRSALFVGNGSTMQMSTYSGLNVSAQSILSGTGDIDRDGQQDLLVDYTIGFTNQTVRLASRAFDGSLVFGNYVAGVGAAPLSGPDASASLFQNAYENHFGSGTHLSTYIGSPTFVSMQPKAFIADVNGDSNADIVYSDGNGFNTSRLMVFDWNGSIGTAHERMTVIREDWGNLTTSLLPLDFDGDGQTEIVLGDATDNSMHVFKHADNGDYVEVFADSYGGYTGTAYNPAITVGDVDGNGAQDVIIGQGGHCSVPTVGSGVYVYGLGMVFHDGDHDGDGIAESDDGMGVWTVSTGDLDGDGTDEIVAGSQTGQLYVLRHRVVPSVAPTMEVL